MESNINPNFLKKIDPPLGGKEKKKEKIGNEGKKGKKEKKGYKVLPAPHTTRKPHRSKSQRR